MPPRDGAVSPTSTPMDTHSPPLQRSSSTPYPRPPSPAISVASMPAIPSQEASHRTSHQYIPERSVSPMSTCSSSDRPSLGHETGSLPQPPHPPGDPSHPELPSNGQPPINTTSTHPSQNTPQDAPLPSSLRELAHSSSPSYHAYLSDASSHDARFQTPSPWPEILRSQEPICPVVHDLPNMPDPETVLAHLASEAAESAQPERDPEAHQDRPSELHQDRPSLVQHDHPHLVHSPTEKIVGDVPITSSNQPWVSDPYLAIYQPDHQTQNENDPNEANERGNRTDPIHRSNTTPPPPPMASTNSYNSSCHLPSANPSYPNLHSRNPSYQNLPSPLRRNPTHSGVSSIRSIYLAENNRGGLHNHPVRTVVSPQGSDNSGDDGSFGSSVFADPYPRNPPVALTRETSRASVSRSRGSSVVERQSRGINPRVGTDDTVQGSLAMNDGKRNSKHAHFHQPFLQQTYQKQTLPIATSINTIRPLWKEILLIITLSSAPFLMFAALAQGIDPLALAIGSDNSSRSSKTFSVADPSDSLENLSLIDRVPRSYGWYTTTYMIAVGAAIPPGARVALLFGHKFSFILGMGLLALASLLCGFAERTASPGYFLFCRAFQGIGSAIAAPSGFVLARELLSDARRLYTLGLLSAFMPIGMVTGVVMTNLFASWKAWEWAFFGMAATALAFACIAIVIIPDTRELQGPPRSNVLHNRSPFSSREKKMHLYVEKSGYQGNEQKIPLWKSMDLLGMFLWSTSFTLFSVAWNQGPLTSWKQAYVAGFMVGGIFLAGLFIWVESNAEYPLLPFSLFSNRVAWLIVALTVTGWGTMIIWLFYTFQKTLLTTNDNPLWASAGLAFAPLSAIISGFMAAYALTPQPPLPSPSGNPMAEEDREPRVHGPSTILFLSALFFGVGNLMMVVDWPSSSAWVGIILGGIFVGMAMTMSFTAATVWLADGVMEAYDSTSETLVLATFFASSTILLGLARTIESAILDRVGSLSIGAAVDSEVVAIIAAKQAIKGAQLFGMAVAMFGFVAGIVVSGIWVWRSKKKMMIVA